MGDSEKLKMLVSEQVKKVLQTGEPKEQPPKNTRGIASATQKAKGMQSRPARRPTTRPTIGQSSWP